MEMLARTEIFEQAGYGARLEWGETGVRALAPDVDVLVLVDVLSFTTAVEVAVARGARVYPYPVGDVTAAALATRVGAVLALDRRQAPADRPYSLSPASLATLPPGTPLVLPSPNGSALTVLAADLHHLILAGCLRNARAAATATQALGSTVGRSATLPAQLRLRTGTGGARLPRRRDHGCRAGRQQRGTASPAGCLRPPPTRLRSSADRIESDLVDQVNLMVYERAA
jgi:2-phosphosulpholactate phosphatase